MERSQTPLAIVNSKAIYDSDIDEMIAQMGPRGQAYQSAEGRAVILEQLIAQRLFLADAMRNLYEREPAFKEELQRIKEQLLTQYAISKAVDGVTVTDIEARKFFDENRDQFAAQGQEGRGADAASDQQGAATAGIGVESAAQARQYVQPLTAPQRGETPGPFAHNLVYQYDAPGGTLADGERAAQVEAVDGDLYEFAAGDKGRVVGSELQPPGLGCDRIIVQDCIKLSFHRGQYR